MQLHIFFARSHLSQHLKLFVIFERETSAGVLDRGNVGISGFLEFLVQIFHSSGGDFFELTVNGVETILLVKKHAGNSI